MRKMKSTIVALIVFLAIVASEPLSQDANKFLAPFAGSQLLELDSDPAVDILTALSGEPKLPPSLHETSGGSSLSEQLMKQQDARRSTTEQELDVDDELEADVKAGQYLRKGFKIKKMVSGRRRRWDSGRRRRWDGGRRRRHFSSTMRYGGYRSAFHRVRPVHSYYVYGLYGAPYGYHRYGYGHRHHWREPFRPPRNSSEHLPVPQGNTSVVLIVRRLGSDANQTREQIMRFLEKKRASADAFVSGVHRCRTMENETHVGCLDEHLRLYIEERTSSTAAPQQESDSDSDSDSQVDEGAEDEPHQDSSMPAVGSSEGYAWVETLGEGHEAAAAYLNKAINEGSLTGVSSVKTGQGASVLIDQESAGPALARTFSAGIAALAACISLLF